MTRVTVDKSSLPFSSALSLQVGVSPDDGQGKQRRSFADMSIEIGATTAVLEGSRVASTTEAQRMLANTDRSGYVSSSMPDGVVFAESTEDIVATMTLATANRVPLVTRGAGTGLAAGAAAHAGEVVLDVSRMNQILRIDPVEQLAVVQPGVSDLLKYAFASC